ncbi:hypothetical protein MGYG_00544 [Nannizzia gypsea CBS 118893]|uniref:Uncharacterized protein n=1 Tax=Arthroderma gypseum (strain ATCC MYA-4604 / CBS 118893) TaxID=535722 RepID=E5R0E5_ARTGP|nr:hypothetical protein MGYG_00544 [Nannizzia gypsea CBS 118893]EFQ97504.1 hypothetical protein MGYG_00544 [Nannizzia gypsea CBS 118893]
MNGQNSSLTSSGSEGAALPWILEHLLAYPGSYEIPLRTMYTLNSSPRTADLSSGSPSLNGSAFSKGGSTPSPASSAPSSRHEKHGSSDSTMSDTAARFKAQMMAQIAQLPSQPASLPPSFITSFVRRSFPPVLEEVDFPQALTALDYLRDLENRRKREVVNAFDRLGLTGTDSERLELSRRYPGVLAWVKNIERNERDVIALYTQVYLRIRYWALVNEMLLTPFNRYNCIALLNTLFPPLDSRPPTPHLNGKLLLDHRMRFYDYICSFEKKGVQVLKHVIEQDKRPGEKTGWPVARGMIDSYLNLANSIINECSEVTGCQHFEEATEAGQRKGRKVDSGISFTSSERPSTSGSSSSSSKNSTKNSAPPSQNMQHKGSNGSTLEKIAREIKKLKSRGDLRDAAKEPKRPNTVKKIKSSGLLRETMRGLSMSDEPTFDPDKFKQQRKQWEAKNAHKLRQATE